MEHKTKRMSFKMDEYDEEEGVFSGYGAVFETVDSGGDIIESTGGRMGAGENPGFA